MSANQTAAATVRNAIRPLGAGSKPACSFGEHAIQDRKTVREPNGSISFVPTGTWSCRPVVRAFPA
jgi:hypothetical protein